MAAGRGAPASVGARRPSGCFPGRVPSTAGEVDQGLHILVVSAVAPPRVGGIETMLDVLTRGMADAGHIVAVLTDMPGANFDESVARRRLYVAPSWNTRLRLHLQADVVFH